MSRFSSLTYLSLSLAVAAFLGTVDAAADDTPKGGVYLPDLSDEEIRALPHRQRGQYAQIKALEEVMREEGPEFSQEKFDDYNLRFGLGLVATVLGGGAMVTGGTLAFLSVFHLGSSCPDGECGSEDREREERDHDFRIAGLFSALGGAVLLSVGVPFLYSGKKGRNRQRRLLQNEKILRPLREDGWKLSVLHDRAGRAAGLSMSVVF